MGKRNRWADHKRREKIIYNGLTKFFIPVLAVVLFLAGDHPFKPQFNVIQWFHTTVVGSLVLWAQQRGPPPPTAPRAETGSGAAAQRGREG